MCSQRRAGHFPERSVVSAEQQLGFISTGFQPTLPHLSLPSRPSPSHSSHCEPLPTPGPCSHLGVFSYPSSISQDISQVLVQIWSCAIRLIDLDSGNAYYEEWLLMDQIQMNEWIYVLKCTLNGLVNSDITAMRLISITFIIPFLWLSCKPFSLTRHSFQYPFGCLATFSESSFLALLQFCFDAF